MGGLIKKSMLSLVTQNCEAKLNFHTRIGLSFSNMNRTSVWAEAPVRPQRMRKYRLVAWFPLTVLLDGKQRLQVLQGPDLTFSELQKQNKTKQNKTKQSPLPTTTNNAVSSQQVKGRSFGNRRKYTCKMSSLGNLQH